MLDWWAPDLGGVPGWTSGWRFLSEDSPSSVALFFRRILEKTEFAGTIA